MLLLYSVSFPCNTLYGQMYVDTCPSDLYELIGHPNTKPWVLIWGWAPYTEMPASAPGFPEDYEACLWKCVPIQPNGNNGGGSASLWKGFIGAVKRWRISLTCCASEAQLSGRHQSLLVRIPSDTKIPDVVNIARKRNKGTDAPSGVPLSTEPGPTAPTILSNGRTTHTSNQPTA